MIYNSSKFLKAIILCVILSSCMQQTLHVQQGNPTGLVKDNKWDYYNGIPIHYTSYQRDITKDGILVVNEVTDAFSGTFNLDKSKQKGSLLFNGQTIIVTAASADQIRQKRSNWSDTMVNSYDKLYTAEEGDVYVAVHHNNQAVIVGYVENGNDVDIGYLPSRYLACKKISMMQQAANAAIMAELVKTALVAGVQSYTSYSTSNNSGTIYGSNGNFGYVGTSTTRDYSWAGDRASDALDTVFSGNANMQTLNAAWDSMQCY